VEGLAAVAAAVLAAVAAALVAAALRGVFSDENQTHRSSSFNEPTPG